jgi:hypothetical protein
LTPSFQLQPCSRHSPWGDERRTGPALPCDGLFGRSEGSKARPLTFPVTPWFNPNGPRGRESGPRLTQIVPGGRGSLPPRRRQEARLPRSGASSINRCSQTPCLRRMAQEPATVLGRRCRHRVGFRRSASFPPERPSGPHLRGSPSFVPGRPALPMARSLRPGR